MLKLYQSWPSRSCSVGVLFQNILEFHSCKKTMMKAVQHPFKMKSKSLKEKQLNIVKEISVSNQYERLSDFVTPYWKLSYEEELKIKQKMCEDVVNHVLNNSEKNKPHQSKRHDAVMGNIIASPVRDAYRNKDEFSVWPGVDGNPKTVGFFVGSPAVGKVVCIPPTHLKCIKESHKEIAQLYQNYIRSSPLPVSYQLFDGGFWRNIVVRSNEAGDHMIIVITNSRGFTPEFIAEQVKLLQEYFSELIPSMSLFHQSCPHLKCTRAQAPIHHLYGQPHLTENMSKYTLRISPDSFYQSNQPAAEILYQEALKLAKLTHFTTMLDLYCGTGTLSLTASKQVRGCVGIEEVATAVEDATHNAHINNVTNCTFHSGKVELKLHSVLNDLDQSAEIVAVVNPGRAGAAESVLSLLRQQTNIRRVVYISCRPDNFVTLKNFNQLCERVSPNSKPFRLVKAIPVDLFPYASHCELVLCFDKM